jgi:DNA-binding Lrp family transcriptional regulator
MLKALKKLFSSGYENSEAKSFDEKQHIEEAYDTKERGIKTVPLDQIIGSVGRYHDFDSEYRPKQHMPSARMQSIKSALKNGKVLPPVKLYQIKNEYYVLDGNHRVAMAKELHWDSIQAKIVEFISSKETICDILYNEKSDFLERTGLLAKLELTEIGQYRRMMDQIVKHRAFMEEEKWTAITLKEASSDWYKTIYLPLVGIIEKANLINAFQKRTISDLYMYVSTHQWGERLEREYGKEIDSLIPKSMEEFRAVMYDKKDDEYPDMHVKITVFILMNVEAKKEKKIIETIYDYKETREIHSVHGNHDLLVKFKLKRDILTSDAETISIYMNRIRLLSGVKSTHTLIPGFSKSKEDNEKK